MKRRDQVMKGASSTDLLVCFPTRSHLTLMPKTICSPSRTSTNPQNHRHYHRGKSIGGGGGGGGLWSKRNQMGSELSEPTSPKVTCAGQIKIEMRLDKNKKHKKKPNWVEAIGLKKESMQFLTCLKSFKFDLGCFGAFPNVDDEVNDDYDDDNDDDDGSNHEKKVMGIGGHHHEDGSSRSTFSKWFMVLENLEEIEKPKDDVDDDNDDDDDDDDDGDDDGEVSCVPPSNALLLMRCHSAPTKSWLDEKEEEEQDDGEEHHDDDDDGDDDDDDDGMKKGNLMDVMKYEGDFYKLSCDIAKETWVVGGIKEDPFSRTQSSKRCSTKCLEEVKAYLQ